MCFLKALPQSVKQEQEDFGPKLPPALREYTHYSYSKQTKKYSLNENEVFTYLNTNRETLRYPVGLHEESK